MKNPFVTNGYVAPEYFCDREKETKQLVSFLTNGNNVALISPRRIGKTDLIRHVFHQDEIKDHYYTFLIDVYSTRNLSEFVSIFGATILERLKGTGRKAWEQFLGFLTSIKAQIGFDSNGQPSWTVGFGKIDDPMLTLDEIFRYLQQASMPCLVAIDEFQQIAKYAGGENVEATLRTYIQRCSNANFIFSGSQRHMMDEMFTSSARPFYQSVIIYNLQTLPLEKYVEFCKYHFNKCGKVLESDVVPMLYEKFNSTTAYMQKIMNLMFADTPVGGTCKVGMIDDAISTILDISADSYRNLLYQLPDKQKELLEAIAREGEVTDVSSGAFVQRIGFQSSSSVVSALKGLIDKDLVTRNLATYSVCDQFLALYITQR